MEEYIANSIIVLKVLWKMGWVYPAFILIAIGGYLEYKGIID